MSAPTVPGRADSPSRHDPSAPGFRQVLALALGLALAFLHAAHPAAAPGIVRPEEPSERDRAESAYYRARSLMLAAATERPSSAPLVHSGTGKPGSRGPVLPSAAAGIPALLKTAWEGSDGIIRLESARLLLRRMADSGDVAGGLALAPMLIEAHGPDRELLRARLDLLRAAGSGAGLAEAVGEFRSIDRTRPGADADLLAWYEISDRFDSGDDSWRKAALEYLAVPSMSAGAAAILDFLSALDSGEYSVPEPAGAAARLRTAVFRRRQAEGWKEFLPAAAAILVPGVAPALVSDAGRACLASGEPETGLGVFTALSTDPSRSGWLAGFYAARIDAVSGRPASAAAAFAALAKRAHTAADRDSALWHRIDSLDRVGAGAGLDPGTIRRLRIAALEEASKSWHSPGWFEDLVESTLRSALADGDGETLRLLAGRIAPGSGATVATRLVYSAARFAEHRSGTAQVGPRDTGTPAPADETEFPWRAEFRRILGRTDAPLHYRALAGWRLGVDLELLPFDPFMDAGAVPPAMRDAEGNAPATTAIPAGGSVPSPAPVAAPAGGTHPDGPGGTERFVLGFLAHGLAGLAGSEARTRVSALDTPALRRIAEILAKHLNVADSVRLARVVVDRSGDAALPSDYRLLYPRPWRAIVVRALGDSGIPEPLAFGLVRSESLFDPSAVSRSGAVGLSQLMPATAAETAGRMGMARYRITDPADNLAIGFMYYRSMVTRFGGRPMRGMFAYNAGPTRMRRWEAAFPHLPDDLVLEALDIAEPRQYGRNIVHAALHYGALYEGWSSSGVLDYLVEARLP